MLGKVPLNSEDVFLDTIIPDLNSGTNIKASEVGAKERLGFYKLLKYHNNREACEEFASGLEGQHAYLCEIIFSNATLNDILDNVAEDMAYFLLSERYPENYLCNQIKNINVRSGCFSSKDVNEYFWSSYDLFPEFDNKSRSENEEEFPEPEAQMTLIEN